MAWMTVPAGMPAAIMGSMTCSRIRASERPVLKMTGMPAAARATRSRMMPGLTSRVTGLATGPSTSSRRASGGAAGWLVPGADTAGDSETVMGPFCQQDRRHSAPPAPGRGRWSLFGYNLPRASPATFAGAQGCLLLHGDIQSCGRGPPLPRPWLQHPQAVGVAAAAAGPAGRTGDHQTHAGPRSVAGRRLHILRRLVPARGAVPGNPLPGGRPAPRGPDG